MYHTAVRKGNAYMGSILYLELIKVLLHHTVRSIEGIVLMDLTTDDLAGYRLDYGICERCLDRCILVYGSIAQCDVQFAVFSEGYGFLYKRDLPLSSAS